MKKYFFIYVSIAIFVFLSACSQKQTTTLNLPEKSDIVKIYYIAENEYKSTTDKENIDNLLFELSQIKSKTFDSFQDTPLVEKYSEINFEMSIGTSSNKVFVYKTKEGFFVEQPYNGIFTINESQYQSIVGVFSN